MIHVGDNAARDMYARRQRGLSKVAGLCRIMIAQSLQHASHAACMTYCDKFDSGLTIRLIAMSLCQSTRLIARPSQCLVVFDGLGASAAASD